MTFTFLFIDSQPRILMAMARDGLLPSFFSDINKRTQVPIKSTVATGICAAFMAFCLDVSQLAGMVRVLEFDFFHIRATENTEIKMSSCLGKRGHTPRIHYCGNIYFDSSLCPTGQGPPSIIIS